jgi:hypothetical protein
MNESRTQQTEKGLIPMKKMSYVSAIDAVLSGAPITDEVAERLTSLRGSLAKRATRKAGPTKAQIANAEIGEAVASAMTVGEVYTIADATALVPALAGATPQKVGPILRRLRDAGRLTESKVKGKVVYSLAE